MFPVAFLVAAVVVAFGTYSYVKLSHAFPSSAGPAMFLREGALSLFMYVSMVLGESLVARVFFAHTYGREPASAVQTGSCLRPQIRHFGRVRQSTNPRSRTARGCVSDP